MQGTRCLGPRVQTCLLVLWLDDALGEVGIFKEVSFSSQTGQEHSEEEEGEERE